VTQPDCDGTGITMQNRWGGEGGITCLFIWL